jgi:hypothetical protein
MGGKAGEIVISVQIFYCLVNQTHSVTSLTRPGHRKQHAEEKGKQQPKQGTVSAPKDAAIF